MDAVHVIMEIPLAREAIARLGSVTTGVGAWVGLSAVAMHTVRLPLMSKQARSRRKLQVLATSHLATIWLEVGVHKFAVHRVSE